MKFTNIWNFNQIYYLSLTCYFPPDHFWHCNSATELTFHTKGKEYFGTLSLQSFCWNCWTEILSPQFLCQRNTFQCGPEVSYPDWPVATANMAAVGGRCLIVLLSWLLAGSAAKVTPCMGGALAQASMILFDNKKTISPNVGHFKFVSNLIWHLISNIWCRTYNIYLTYDIWPLMSDIWYLTTKIWRPTSAHTPALGKNRGKVMILFLKEKLKVMMTNHLYTFNMEIIIKCPEPLCKPDQESWLCRTRLKEIYMQKYSFFNIVFSLWKVKCLNSFENLQMPGIIG